MISIESLQVALEGQIIIPSLSLEIAKGERVALIGPSGSGKSILLKAISGVIPSDGTRVLGGSCALLFQEGALFDSISVFDNVAFPLVQGNVPANRLDDSVRHSCQAAVSEMLDRVGLRKAAWRIPAELSGGMRRRVSLARALIAKPEIVLLDEPTFGLDPIASGVIMKLIRETQEEFSMTAIIVSHDLRRLLPMASRIVGMDRGQIVFDGTLQQLAQKTDDATHGFAACRYTFGGATNEATPTTPRVNV